MKINMVDYGARFDFSRELIEMHHDRKRVFVDRLGWQLASPGSWLEVDQFDNEYTVYLIACGPDGHHLASVRLNPTTRPHMIDSLFPFLCEEDPVTGPEVWESSRFTIAPLGLRGTEVMRLSQYLALAHVEFALLNGISRYTMIGEVHRVATVVSMGWKVRPLCLPTKCGGDQVQALEVSFDAGTLESMRKRFRVDEPVLCVRDGERLAA
jgi:acyl-homoserine lactone synthase